MNTKVIILIISVFLLTNCKDKPSQANLTKVLNSKSFSIHLLKSRGNFGGNPRRSKSKDKFIVTSHNNVTQAIYYVPAKIPDSIYEFKLNNKEIDTLLTILKYAVVTHNPYKKYDGCCMCSNIDFQITNNEIDMEVKPSEEVEYLYYSLIGKYQRILYEDRQEFFNKIEPVVTVAIIDTIKCTECGSKYVSSASQMEVLCPECSHYIYGYKNCNHTFENNRCTKCYWNGNSSEYIETLKLKQAE